MRDKKSWTKPNYLAHITEEEIKAALDSLDVLHPKTSDLMSKLNITRSQALRLLRDEKYEHLRPSSLSVNIRRGRPFKNYTYIEEIDPSVLAQVCTDWMNDMSAQQIARKHDLNVLEIRGFLAGKLCPDFQKPEGFVAPPRRRLSPARKEKTEKVRQALEDLRQGKIAKRELVSRLGVSRQAVNFMLRGITFSHVKVPANEE